MWVNVAITFLGILRQQMLILEDNDLKFGPTSESPGGIFKT